MENDVEIYRTLFFLDPGSGTTFLYGYFPIFKNFLFLFSVTVYYLKIPEGNNYNPETSRKKIRLV
jgi:hypothetical protein